MTLKAQDEHQGVSAVVFDIEAAALSAGANTVCHLPPGAVVVGGFIAVLTAFNAACTIDIGDAGVGNRYGNDLDLHTATGVQQLTLSGYEHTAATEAVRITPSSVSSTTGTIRVCLEYIVTHRSNFSIG